jgi:hypothetical protein
VIDADGKEVLPFLYDGMKISAWGCQDHRIFVRRDQKWGLMDHSGNEVTACRYDEMEALTKDLVKIGIAGKYGIIANSGEEFVSPIYDEITWCVWHSQYISVCLNGKWGVLDTNARELTPPKYDHFLPLVYRTLARFVRDGHIVYIDGQGNEYLCKNEQ